MWVLFETGARAEEFLNIRLAHVEDKTTHFVVWIEFPKTYRRSAPVYEGAEHLRAWLRKHPRKGQPEAQLFPISYDGFRKYLGVLGQRALGKHVHPHLLRHSFATWLASKRVGRYQMCKLLGWAMSSDMPDRYIDRAGVVEAETIANIRGDELAAVERENTELKRSLQQLESRTAELQEQNERRAKIDAFLNELFQDKKLRAAEAEKVGAKGSGPTLIGL